MDEVTTIGIDLAKRVFEVALKAADGRIVKQLQLRRAAFERYMSEEAPRALVGLEAGPSAHYWARWLGERGFAVKVMAPRAVQPYRVGPHKSDRLDAPAIAEAASRRHIRSVAVKSEQAQIQQGLLRVRDRQVGDRTQVLNQLRALLLEFGIVAPRNLLTWYLQTAAMPGFAALPERALALLEALFEEAQALDRRVRGLDAELARSVRTDPVARLATTVPGIGPINGTQIGAHVVDPGDFRRARDFPASIGMVPRLSGTGGKARLGPITKHGSPNLRRGLVLGAQSIITVAIKHPDKADPIYAFARRLIAKGKHRNLVAVAVANKLARIVAAMLRDGRPYNPSHAVA